MKINLNKFKKIASDKTSSTLVSPEGHQIKMAHASLSPEMRGQIKSLPLCEGGEVPHFDDGGKVSSEDSPNQSSDDQSIPGVNININTTPQGGMSVGEPAQPHVSGADQIKNAWAGQQYSNAPAAASSNQVVDQAMAPQAQPQAPAPGPGPDASTSEGDTSSIPIQNANSVPTPDMMAGYNKAAGELRAGYGQEAAANQQLASDNQKIQQEYQNIAQTMQNHFQKSWDDNTRNVSDTIDDVYDHHINPNQYMENMSATDKVGTAIGLILGGFAGGVLHQENPVAKFLDNQINRDMDAQKANLGSVQNILGAYLKQYGNISDAENMARATQYGIYSSKLKEAAAKASDPMAKARLLQQAGDLDMKMAPLINQTSLRQAAMGTMQSGIAQDPAAKIRLMGMSGLMAPKDVEQASKELGQNENINATKDMAVKAFDHLNDKFLKGSLTPSDRDSAIWSIAGKIQKDTEGRFNIEAATKLVGALFPNAGDLKSTAGNKRERLINLFQTMGSTPTLDRYRISPYRNMNSSQITEGAPVR